MDIYINCIEPSIQLIIADWKLNWNRHPITLVIKSLDKLINKPIAVINLRTLLIISHYRLAN